MKIPSALKYLLLMFAGITIIFAGSMFQSNPLPPKGEYFLSEWLRNNFTWPVRIIFCFVGFLAGYFMKLNPILTGISLSAVFPVIAIYEATIHRGSHNLIPLEFFTFIIWSLPAILASYAGAYFSRKPAKNP